MRFFLQFWCNGQCETHRRSNTAATRRILPTCRDADRLCRSAPRETRAVCRCGSRTETAGVQCPDSPAARLNDARRWATGRGPADCRLGLYYIDGRFVALPPIICSSRRPFSPSLPLPVFHPHSHPFSPSFIPTLIHPRPHPSPPSSIPALSPRPHPSLASSRPSSPMSPLLRRMFATAHAGLGFPEYPLDLFQRSEQNVASFLYHIGSLRLNSSPYRRSALKLPLQRVYNLVNTRVKDGVSFDATRMAGAVRTIYGKDQGELAQYSIPAYNGFWSYSSLMPPRLQGGPACTPSYQYARPRGPSVRRQQHQACPRQAADIRRRCALPPAPEQPGHSGKPHRGAGLARRNKDEAIGCHAWAWPAPGLSHSLL